MHPTREVVTSKPPNAISVCVSTGVPSSSFAFQSRYPRLRAWRVSNLLKLFFKNFRLTLCRRGIVFKMET